jgi:hypothetical protein
MRSLCFIALLILVAAVSGGVSAAADARPPRHQNMDCCTTIGNGQCNLEKRGWCGKRKGDWYGARRPVTSISDAREQLARYFAGRQLSVAELSEKPWRYEADLLDSSGRAVDRVMIDKRSGRIRSIY